MRFVDAVLRVLGFETESKPIKKKKTKNIASFNLKEAEKPTDINGVPVYYCDNVSHIEKCILKVKDNKSIIINLEDCASKDAMKLIEYIKGAAFATEAKLKNIEPYVYLLIPKGVELEIEE